MHIKCLWAYTEYTVMSTVVMFARYLDHRRTPKMEEDSIQALLSHTIKISFCPKNDLLNSSLLSYLKKPYEESFDNDSHLTKLSLSEYF